jgi:predicted nucleotidyltransferase
LRLGRYMALSSRPAVTPNQRISDALASDSSLPNSSDASLEHQLPLPVVLLLNRFRCVVDELAPRRLAALYLYGSAALGDFVEGVSDVDLIAVLNREVGGEDVRTLALVHRTIAKEFLRCPMEVSYLQWRDLGCSKEAIPAYPCYHGGRMHRATHHDISPVTWWMLKHHSAVIFGPGHEPLPFEITWGEVRAYMVTNLDTYWAAWMNSPRGRAYLLTDSGVQWAVLGICRLLYGLREGGVISKSQAGRYALTEVSERWASLIEEALALRMGLRSRCRGGRLARARDSSALVKYMIALCKSSAR